jgi:hypothetical protein
MLYGSNLYCAFYIIVVVRKIALELIFSQQENIRAVVWMSISMLHKCNRFDMLYLTARKYYCSFDPASMRQPWARAQTAPAAAAGGKGLLHGIRFPPPWSSKQGGKEE